MGRKHVICLSNGQKVGLEEGENRLTITSLDDTDTDWYICQICSDGVLVYPNSGAEPEMMTRGLKDAQ